MKYRLLIFLTLIITTSVFAQFSKYKAKTQFQNKNSKTSNESSSTKDQDFFGRGTGVRGAKKTSKEDKYVNLNPETAFGPEVVSNFDFSNTSLLELTKHMQKLTGLNLMWDKEINGKMTILASTPITVGDAWKAYLTALNVNGYTLVKSGAFYRIVDSRSSRSTPSKIYTGAFIPQVESYLMKIIPIKHIQSSEIYRNFRSFMNKNGRIVNIKQTNTIIVHDTGTNINRLVKLIRLIDIPGHEESLHILPMKHSSAQEIAKILDTILKSKQGKSGKFSSKAVPSRNSSNISKIIAEPRTNSIIALANIQGIKKLKSLIKKLDVKYGAQSSDKIHVYYLNYGSAKELSKTLSTLVSSTGKKSNKNVPRRILLRRQETDSGLFSTDIKITSDESNNALVVTSSPTDWLTIEQVIKKLDIPREQVYVEGMIMETNISRNRDVGISIVGAYGTGTGQKAGFIPDSGIIDLISNNLTNLGGFFVGGSTGKKVTLDVGGSEITVDSVTGLIKAIASDSNTNVLATPQILVLDNEEAEFEVGESIPISETVNNNGVSSVNTKTQDVTLKIKITPQINKVTRFIKLKINQDIRDFSQRKVEVSQGVATTTRRAITTVVVRDRDTIAMGGLMRDQLTDTENKVPLLGDIPVLGWLFKSKKSVISKINLLFFLTPQILSPYEQTTGPLLKDAVGRRAAHLKNVHGEDDPFKSTAKAIFEKGKQQKERPLYEKIEGSHFFKKQNKQEGIGNPQAQIDKEVPNYSDIHEEVSEIKQNISEEE